MVIFKIKRKNEDYLMETSDLHQIDGKNVEKSITARIFSKQRLVNFTFEEYGPNNVFIINCPDRIKDIYKLSFKDNDITMVNRKILFLNIKLNYFHGDKINF